MMIKKIGIAILCILYSVSTFELHAQETENVFQSRLGFAAEFKPFKKFQLKLSPEFRFNNNFSLAKYHLETEGRYKLGKGLYLGADYRFTVNPRETKSTAYASRFGVYAKYKLKINRITPSLKLTYSNYVDDLADENSVSENYLRYKAGIKYNIPNFKLTPGIAAELFHNTGSGEFYKMRYKLGFDYKLFKNNYINLNYKLDYYLQEYKNKHIFSLGYTLKF